MHCAACGHANPEGASASSTPHWRLRGDDDAARRDLTEAHRLFVATGGERPRRAVAVTLAEVPG